MIVVKRNLSTVKKTTKVEVFNLIVKSEKLQRMILWEPIRVEWIFLRNIFVKKYRRINVMFTKFIAKSLLFTKNLNLNFGGLMLPTQLKTMTCTYFSELGKKLSLLPTGPRLTISVL